jgi:DNA-binding GntR family transcriptional regulator
MTKRPRIGYKRETNGKDSVVVDDIMQQRRDPPARAATETSFKHRNLPDQLADHIVLLLAKGELQPGQRLFESDLCRQLGVSRVPLREALRLLQAQGVVNTEPNRGSFINRFGTEEANEFLKIRLSVEQIALRRLVRLVKADKAVLTPFEDIIQKMRQADTVSDRLASCQADLAFHGTIVELSGSQVLLPIWNSISRGIFVYFMQERLSYYDYSRSITDHQILLDAVRQGDADALDRAIENHIMATPGADAPQVIPT